MFEQFFFSLDPRLQLLLVANAFVALVGGALITPLVYWAKGRKPSSGFFAGVLTGAVGNLVFLILLWALVKPRRPQNATAPFDVAVTYNMGVGAVLGNRLEEARYYFVQATQIDPRHIGSWLYLANLATTPLEAWSYVQQARAIDPADPLVQEAVTIVWPQVRHLYGEQQIPPPAPTPAEAKVLAAATPSPAPMLEQAVPTPADK